MPRIFISYRRDDSADVSEDLAEVLARVFGANNVFFDRVSIRLGEPFPNRLRNAIDDANVMLVIIGERWLSERLHQPDDFVYLEVRRGLDRSHLRVIPVLLDATPMPGARDLPTDIAQLVHLNAFVLHTDRRGFGKDAEHLCELIGMPLQRRRAFLLIAALVLLALLSIGIGLLTQRDGSSPDATTITEVPATTATLTMTTPPPTATVPREATTEAAAEVIEATPNLTRTADYRTYVINASIQASNLTRDAINAQLAEQDQPPPFTPASESVIATSTRGSTPQPAAQSILATNTPVSQSILPTATR